jgi:hypothetical protein
MASYKVPQDVEADDKLIGPFSFRQFIYLLIVAMAGAIAWGLYNIFPPLAAIPIPIIVVFGALALPLKKDQPMEVYLAALVSFYLKPRRRLWVADGINDLITISAPKTVESALAKNISQDEAERRINYLAQIVDTKGWAVRGVESSQQNTSVNDDIYNEAQQTVDMLDNTNAVAESFNKKIADSNQKHYQRMVETIKHETNNISQNSISTPTNNSDTLETNTFSYNNQFNNSNTGKTVSDYNEDSAHFNPYPEDMHQAVVKPIEQAEQKSSTRIEPVSPDIINLVNNSTDLTIATIAHEADRIVKKKHDLNNGDEVVISLH